ncbi:5-(carboxyamino)imidazole ribonucleotide mutase [Methanobrevibacter gottschalkii]|uniref:N5-carboxyaminoimidazole ribonucleotide mutase n=2 Tax=Methanobrevibacter gottschalkii TaxID=190974 RepID=A0A3N5C423_9EURY|nr:MULTISPECIES: 5-(carboxyamino)imidazole ribonucleotide mutase [Methanobrevibacter]MCQ2970862.1 5-(carboxyamino)imidazole ribonucleotide mutase [archaeon]OEC99908.1 5-(carboxyamino)imidazole ribonucleotide mutase [Methanobrevibacter sp. A27]RPF52875.1 5-(carboxyamino)imidazole ribonucleotide mutase [Methanobrevibacter gottschalkii DSM 11977]SEK18484.1 5-(carboxyamino)imidazole ribonucleotide mutase [Methanobrevibacter gottschalkii]
MTPKIMIILGSGSDIAIAEKSMKILEKLEIPYSLKIASAHRTPDLVREIVIQGTNAGIEVFIGIAGLAAHLPGAIAAYTPRPVIGVPVDVKTGGVDALESIVQMPYPSPIATVGIDRGDNAAILAAQFIGLHDDEIRQKIINLRKNYALKVKNSNEEIIQKIEDKKFLQNDFLRIKDLNINDIEADESDPCCKNKNADVAIIVGRQTDVVTAKKVAVILDRLKISHDTKVVCPIRSTKKFTNYVKAMKNAKIFIGISSNSSQVTGGIVGLTDRPVIGVPCTNENGDDYMLTTVSMPPGVPVATVGINNGKNAAVLAGEILSINNPSITELLGKIKNKKINL